MSTLQAVSLGKVESLHKNVDGVVFQMFNNSNTILVFWGNGEKDRVKASIPFNIDSLYQFGKRFLKSFPF